MTERNLRPISMLILVLAVQGASLCQENWEETLNALPVDDVLYATGYGIVTHKHEFDVRLHDLMRGADSSVATCQRIEQAILKLVEEYDSPDTRGAAYATIVKLYNQRDCSDPERIIHYSNLAWSHPLGPWPLSAIPKSKVCYDWGRAIVAEADKKREPRASVRRQAARKCLEGIALMVDFRVPDQMLDVPTFGGPGMILGGDADIMSKLRKERNEQFRAAQKVRFLNALVLSKRSIEWFLAHLYSTILPQDANELRRLAEEILGADRESYIDALLAKVETAIEERARKEAEHKAREIGNDVIKGEKK